MVKTLKQWVLPPRPKPGRKSTGKELAAAALVPIKRKERLSLTALTPASLSLSSPSAQAQVPTPAPLALILALMPPLKIIDLLKLNIALIDRENVALKLNLLALINDYRQLKQMVLAGDFTDAMAPAFKDPVSEYTSPEASADNSGRSSLKRSFGEVLEMLELINDINELLYGTPGTLLALLPAKAEEDAFSQYIMLELKLYLDESDDDSSDIHNDMALPLLRLLRTISPTLDFDLTLSLTRTTTLTLIGVADTPKPRGFATRKFFELPKFEEETPAAYAFKFDAMMASPHPDDEYHMVNDFLEEKLHDNDLKYYVDHDQILDKW